MRQGEVDAWDNADFRAAVKATGKNQIVSCKGHKTISNTTPHHDFRPRHELTCTPFQIMDGIVTDVCTTFLALSLRAEGYSVWANVEASGTTTEFIRDVSNDRMALAGVQLVSLFSIVCDLMRDWRSTPGAETVIPWLAQYYPVYGVLAQARALVGDRDPRGHNLTAQVRALDAAKTGAGLGLSVLLALASATAASGTPEISRFCQTVSRMSPSPSDCEISASACIWSPVILPVGSTIPIQFNPGWRCGWTPIWASRS